MKTIRFMASALMMAAAACVGMAQTQTVRLFSAADRGTDLTLKVTGEGTVHVRWADGVEGDYSDGTLQGKSNGDTITITMPQTVTGLDCEGAGLSWLEVNGAPALTSLNCADNNLTALNIDSLALLDELRCSGNKLQSLSTAANAKLRYLDCANNVIESLDVSGSALLEVLDCSGNLFESLNLSQNDALRGLWNNGSSVRKLDLSLCRNLNTVVASNGRLSSIKLGPANNLEDLWLDHNSLTVLDLKGTDSLVNANLSDNELDSLDLRDFSTQTKIAYLNCANNHLPFSSFFPYSKVDEYVGGLQTDVYCGYDSIVINEQIDFSYLVTNATNGKIGTLTACDAKTGDELKKGGNGNDYRYVIGKVRFWHEIDSAYFVITNSHYTDLQIRTKPFVVYDPEATAIHSAVASPSGSNGQSSADNAEGSALYDLQGRRVSTPRRGQIYIQNGKKIIY